MKIIVEYNDGKYKLQVVVNNQSIPQIFWYINNGRTATNGRTLAGEIDVVQTNSNGIDLENKIIYISKIHCYINEPLYNKPYEEEIKNEILALLPNITFTASNGQQFKFKVI